MRQALPPFHIIIIILARSCLDLSLLSAHFPLLIALMHVRGVCVYIMERWIHTHTHTRTSSYAKYQPCYLIF
jgi:hypothetical protein